MNPARYKKTVTICVVMALLMLCLITASCSLPRISILHDPLSPEEHINLGLAYEKNGETEQAVEEYKKASGELPDSYLYLGNIYFLKGDTAEAERYYRIAVKKKPDLADAFNNLAWLLFSKKTNLEEARALSQKAVELDPSNDNYKDTLRKIEERLTGAGGASTAP